MQPAAATSPAAPPWPLLGRDHELRTLAAALDDPSVGGVALVGPPGVGKTRLAIEVNSLTAMRGIPTVVIRASASASAIPLGALAPLFSFLDIPPVDSPNPLWLIMRAIEVHERLGAGEDRRLVLVVDDAQQLDPGSMAVIDQLIGRAGILVVLTVRVGETEPDLVALWTGERVRRVQIDPLAAPEISALVRLALGGPVDTAAIHALVEASEGNVLFLRELLQGALETGNLTADKGIWRLTGSLASSPRLRDLIDHRLRELSPEEQEVLQLMALGEPLTIEVLSGLADPGTLEALEARGLLSATGKSPPELQLAHPLYGEVVRSHLPLLRRKRLCRALADVAEAAAGGDTSADRLRIAVWRLEGGGGGDATSMLTAARAAYAGEDFLLAARLARAAWEVSPSVEAAMVLADASDLSGGAEDVERILRSANELASSEEEMTTIAVRLASWLFVWIDRPDEAASVLAAARASASTPEGRALINVQIADHHLLRGDVLTAIEMCSELVQEADGSMAWVQATRDLGVARALAGNTEDAVTDTERALRARRELGGRQHIAVESVFLVALALSLNEAGRLGEAEAAARLGHGAAVTARSLDGQGWFSSILGLILLNEGRLADADGYFREAAAAFRDLGHPAARWGYGGMALAAGQQGEAETAAAAVIELDRIAPGSVRIMDGHLERGRAWAVVASGDTASARAVLHAACERALDLGQLAVAAAHLHDLVRLGERLPAARSLEEMSSDVGGELMAARVMHAKAVLSSDPATAAEAVGGFEACGARLFAAEAALLESRGWSERGLQRRATAARARAQLLVRSCQGARTPALQQPEDHVRLTMREQEVARLASEGLTSREIAEILVLSVRTVDNHLQRVYVKLGVTGRVELAERMSSLRLVADT